MKSGQTVRIGGSIGEVLAVDGDLALIRWNDGSSDEWVCWLEDV